MVNSDLLICTHNVNHSHYLHFSKPTSNPAVSTRNPHLPHQLIDCTMSMFSIDDFGQVPMHTDQLLLYTLG